MYIYIHIYIIYIYIYIYTYIYIYIYIYIYVYIYIYIYIYILYIYNNYIVCHIALNIILLNELVHYKQVDNVTYVLNTGIGYNRAYYSVL